MTIRRHPVAALPASSLVLPIDSALVARLRTFFERLQAHDLRLAEMFYSRLFAAAPELKPLFRTPLPEQARKLMASLHTVVQNFENPAKNAAILRDLGQRHATYGVKPEHYSLVIDALVESMAALLRPHVDRRSLNEWRMALRLISDQMIAAAGDKLTPSPLGG